MDQTSPFFLNPPSRPSPPPPLCFLGGVDFNNNTPIPWRVNLNVSLAKLEPVLKLMRLTRANKSFLVGVLEPNSAQFYLDGVASSEDAGGGTWLNVSGIVIQRVCNSVVKKVVIVHGCIPSHAINALNCLSAVLHTPLVIVFNSVFLFLILPCSFSTSKFWFLKAYAVKNWFKMPSWPPSWVQCDQPNMN